MRRLTYYVGTTIDGFIAGPDQEVDFFPVGEDVMDFIRADFPETLPAHVGGAAGATFDTVVMGRVTYEPALAAGIPSPYPHLRQYVVSGTLGVAPDPSVKVIADDPVAAVRALKASEGGGIWLAGGGRLAATLREEIDELVIKQYPVIGGAGIPMFAGGFFPVRLALAQTRALPGGTVVATYRRAA